jgi:hypothetical protein
MKTFQETSMEAMRRVEKLEATEIDIALTWLLYRFILEIGEGKFKRRLVGLELEFAKAQAEYQAGRV